VHGEEPDVPALDEVLEENVEGRSVEGAEMEFFWVGKRKERNRRVFPKRIATRIAVSGRPRNGNE
jgi:hypothetical protein